MRRPSSPNSSRSWPLVKEASGDAGVPRTSRRRRIALLVVGLALVVGAVLAPYLVAASLGARLGLLLAGFLIAGAGVARRPRPRQPSDVSVVADSAGLTRVSPDTTKPILRWDAPFGVTLLASYGRPQALLAFTTPTQTRYIPTRIDDRSEVDDELFARISVLADLDLVDGVAHDAALASHVAADLVRHVEAEDARALGRVFLSDGRGAPISLDRGTLEVASRAFDLTSHLEWRALMFHESTGTAAALYQATWIKQNGAEVVLVAPMPASIVPREPNAHRDASGRLGRALTRDLRLLQSPAEPPPPRDVRVAIDRPFMLAVRRILDEAPLAARVPVPVPKALPEGRDTIA